MKEAGWRVEMGTGGRPAIRDDIVLLGKVIERNRVIEFGDETGSPRSPKGTAKAFVPMLAWIGAGSLQCPLQSRYFLQEALTNLP
ncbi:hypothetical protein [Burkholderia cenocepacia]|uniref:hypothetical protein n=1 Tax=Burkholderia cenocepacia TaxID=95486 RepID=UPI00196A410A|nr:hypothetical protein [Burkholderia cenocepacia]MBN3506032.1 hypothetical protein [Burkholderia cenocepacia]MCO1395486.1 hypothetical protein [Burkholderia cenocepacia]MCO1411186.1 hypothetical protein [Burkholderia cenocepacia]UQN92942.1 hypothetical protein L0Z06_19845 [Burkholderia cenocepacia]UQO00165.1 hypothetical protein L0Z39_05540 [Burkholderia cenocepacia]